jgi:environmental stress-induced protein Ves
LISLPSDITSHTVSEVTIIEPASFNAMPWRNGLGTTIELLKQDLTDGDGFAWRLSMADVTTNGEFSNFSGYARTLLLLEGNGLTLDCDGAIHRLEKPLQSANFSGDNQTCATLHDGPIKDFNIMVQLQHCSAQVSSAQHPDESVLDVDGEILLVYAVDGELSLSGPGISAPDVPSGHLCVVQDPANGSWLCRGASHIAVQISYHPSSD